MIYLNTFPNSPLENFLPSQVLLLMSHGTQRQGSSPPLKFTEMRAPPDDYHRYPFFNLHCEAFCILSPFFHRVPPPPIVFPHRSDSTLFGGRFTNPTHLKVPPPQTKKSFSLFSRVIQNNILYLLTGFSGANDPLPQSI